MVSQQVSMQEMQLLQEFHEPPLRRAAPRAALRLVFVLVAGLLGLVSACSPAAQSERLNNRTLAQANAILDDIALSELTLSPEAATRLGLEDSAGPSATARLDDHSQAGFERRRLIRLDLLARVRARPVLPSDHPLARDLIVAEDALQRLVQLQAIGHGQLSLSSARAYAIDPYRGVWIDGPDLLANDHAIDTAADADAYLSRLHALVDAIDDTRRRLIADAETGYTPPAALLNQSSLAINALLDPETGPLDRLEQTLSNLVQSLPEISASEARDLTAISATIIADELRPAYRRLSATLETMAVNAPIQAGLWAQPDGHNAYQRLLIWYVGDAPDLEALHQTNLDQVAARAAALQTALDAQGLEPTALPDRLQAYAALLAAAPAQEVDRLRQPALQSPATTARPFMPVSLSGLTYLPARLDGQRPAVIVQDLSQTQQWPGYMHAALHLRADISLRPPFAAMAFQRRTTTRALIEYPSSQVAWRMYASEEYRAEYLGSPSDQIGQLHLHLLDSALAAADTGLHHKRWTLAQTIDYLTETTGLPVPLMREASLRIAAEPGAATAHLISYRRLRALQARARAVLGQRYDETAFQTILLSDGPRPYTMLERDIERWYEAQLAPEE